MTTKKVVVVGAGEPARALARKFAVAEVLDPARSESLPACDIVILFGDPAQSGGHEDLLRRNAGWVRAAAAAAARIAPAAILVVAVPPVNALALLALRVSRFPRSRVLGAAGMAGSLRLARLIAEALGVAAEDVRALTLGGCGQTLVALPRLCSVGGIPAAELLSREDQARLIERACAGAAADEFALAAAQISSALLGGSRRILPCAVHLEGEYGVQDLFLAVPAVLGPGGLERIVQLNLSLRERVAMQKAAGAGRALCARIGVEP